ncbi:hypothetical protein MMUC44124_26780 [Mycolicibacterium mucogenicum DSM 44124]|uniref:Uncharacterized protein n=1 Tax=Mycolicibacterium mucogenicum DSM 44124 TaxID=1226753 RepID=A0A8H2JGC7_MYCMU|nr:hypothetical protein MMUC44124_26780 [Mycolicibacterium mucogenicum DSM 44124]
MLLFELLLELLRREIAVVLRTEYGVRLAVILLPLLLVGRRFLLLLLFSRLLFRLLARLRLLAWLLKRLVVVGWLLAVGRLQLLGIALLGVGLLLRRLSGLLGRVVDVNPVALVRGRVGAAVVWRGRVGHRRRLHRERWSAAIAT